MKGIPKARPLKSGVRIRGFFRVNIVEQDGRIVGDSGWQKNTITNLGKQDYLATPLIGGTAKSALLIGIGSGTAVNATHFSLNGELSHSTLGTRNRISAVTSVQGSTNAQYLGTFASVATGNGFVTALTTVSNLMLINNTTTGGTIFCGQTFASSQVNTNQDIQVTYVVQFG